MKSVKQAFWWVSLFAISMGFLETAVVVYLRELYYPEGFAFPLQPINPKIAVVEFLREAATVIMLLVIGILAGKTKTSRFAWFIYAFAIWDLFYYVFLKLLLGWPESLLTWDILFLIPVPWVGPVITPCLVSLTMAALAMLLVRFEEKGISHQFKLHEKVGLWFGGSLVLLSFLWDYCIFTLNRRETAWLPGSKQALFSEMTNYIPQSFNWWLFGIGEMLVVLMLFTYYKTGRQRERSVSL